MAEIKKVKERTIWEEMFILNLKELTALTLLWLLVVLGYNFLVETIDSKNKILLVLAVFIIPVYFVIAGLYNVFYLLGKFMKS